MPIYTHIPCVYIFIKKYKIQAEIETHAWNIENRLYKFFSLNCFMKISYDFLWQLGNFLRNLRNNKKNYRVGGILG